MLLVLFVKTRYQSTFKFILHNVISLIYICIYFHKARALRHKSTLLRYNARSLRHR